MTHSVSVVIPTHNSESTIERALRSVFAQSVLPREVIVVDDCSTDDTCSIVRTISSTAPCPVHLIVLNQNVGPSQSRNTGWNAATQEFVAFLDSDDSWHPQKLEIQCLWMISHPEYPVTGHLTGPAELAIECECVKVRLFRLRHFLVRNRISTPTVMLRREISERFDVSLWYSEDYELWLRLLSKTPQFVRLEVSLTELHKPAFGDSGLSGKLFAMYQGELKALRSMRTRRQYGWAIWVLLVIWKTAKYLLRIIRTKSRRKP